MTALASILVSLATGILKVWLQSHRADQNAKAVGKMEQSLKLLERANAALKWKATAVRNPRRHRKLRVSKDAPNLQIPGHNSNPPGRTSGDSL